MDRNQDGNNYDYTLMQDCKDIKMVIFVLILQGFPCGIYISKWHNSG